MRTEAEMGVTQLETQEAKVDNHHLKLVRSKEGLHLGWQREHSRTDTRGLDVQLPQL